MASDFHRVLAGMRVLALTPVSGYGGFNTSAHRVSALRELGAQVDVVDSSRQARGLAAFPERSRHWLFRRGWPVRMDDPRRDAERLLAAARDARYDIVWLEKAMTIDAATLRNLRRLQPNARVIGFSPDDMQARHNQSQQWLSALPLYDAYFTTKSYNVAELQRLGTQAMFIGNGHDPAAFRPLLPETGDRERLGGPVGFIGSFEAERAQAMLALAHADIPVRVWGAGWEHWIGRHPLLQVEAKPLFGDDFARACASFDINLCFLRRANRDLQTTRSVEIPACGGFMLAERTDEHQALFEEGVEADYFDGIDELVTKCRHYLAHPELARAVAARGLARCQRDGYSNAGRLAHGFTELFARAAAPRHAA